MLILTLATLCAAVLASCECGYKTDEGDVWQFAITTDFTSGVNTSTGFNSAWQITTAVQGDITDSSPYQRNYSSANVNLPTTASPGLKLTASAYTGSAGGAVSCGQVTTQRDDILYGSFRSTFSVNGGSGACAGFFTYADDDNENDVEILTDEGNRQVHFSTQPIATTGATVTMKMPDDAVTSSDQTYRFDWKPNAVTYFADNVLMSNITRHPSTLPSQLILNAWSNGGAFTGGPPTQDMTLSIKSVTMYFNSSDSSAVASFNAQCAKAGTKVGACSVDPPRSVTESLAATASLVVSSSGTSGITTTSAADRISPYSLYTPLMVLGLLAYSMM